MYCSRTLLCIDILPLMFSCDYTIQTFNPYMVLVGFQVFDMANSGSHDGSVEAFSEQTVSDVAMSAPPQTNTSLSSAHHFVSLKLSSRNYLFWRTQMVPFLSGQGLIRVCGCHLSLFD